MSDAADPNSPWRGLPPPHLVLVALHCRDDFGKWREHWMPAEMLHAFDLEVKRQNTETDKPTWRYMVRLNAAAYPFVVGEVVEVGRNSLDLDVRKLYAQIDLRPSQLPEAA